MAEPQPRDRLGGHVGDDHALTGVVADALGEAAEERAIDLRAHLLGGGLREHQLAHEDPRELGLRLVEREERVEDVERLVHQRGPGGQRGERARDGLAEAVLEDERDEVLLRLCVEEERPLGDAGALRHGVRGRRVEPALEEEREGRLAQPRALVLLVLVAPHYDLGHL